MRKLLACLLVLAFPASAHDEYKDWMRPDNPGQSCCNDKDCQPVANWRTTPRGYQAFFGGAWRDVPPEKVLRGVQMPDGGGHICAILHEDTVHWFCFVPGVEG